VCSSDLAVLVDRQEAMQSYGIHRTSPAQDRTLAILGAGHNLYVENLNNDNPKLSAQKKGALTV
jgi:hypothetical protein